MAFIETPTFMRLATELLADDEYRESWAAATWGGDGERSVAG